ncbi:bifunctional acetyl-CoA hydrolase/transferase family protein/GNAT family N-acetyltransferase [Knoellia sinensis]|uniref:bifunctional acetyl-CoA hydrolase/transferase family protein/GNAT family N-acetyltransferase n=1 Tax=Knoellia sinensis TaxID=136100 RepID=UPI000A80A966|nr:bifunctional acetyl-CoA hydrolase/transferase family protein/GNAT family N-acetyltransferase [Knoellia sinensis]
MTEVEGGTTRAGWGIDLVTAEEAAAAVPAGSVVYVGSGCGTPRTVIRALEVQPFEHLGVRLVHHLTDGVRQSGAAGTNFEHRTLFIGSELADVVGRDDQPGIARIEYLPMSVADLPGSLRAGRVRVDVTVVQVTPPRDGRVSLGVSVDAAHAAIDAARIVIAEVNPAMPWTMGASTVPVEAIDLFVEVPAEVICYTHPAVGDVGELIAGYVARIIDDGATVHVGLGRIPSAVLARIKGRRDLAIHSDVITDAVLDLVEAGVVTGAARTSDVGLVVASAAMGTRRLYDAIDGSDRFAFRPIDEVLRGIEDEPRIVSVTQAFRIDLTGQVCVDALGGRPYGGLGTQADFHRAAALSPEGKAIVALSSRQPDGSSSFALRLGQYEAVAIARHELRWVATEFGITYLHGRSLRERAVALIELAHPDDRDGLLDEARRAGLVPSEQKLKSRRPYPVEEERRVSLRDGSQVLVRPTHPGDAPLLQDLFFHLRPEDVRTRFFRNLSSLARNAADHLCNVSYDAEMALVAVTGGRETERAVATAQYYVDADTGHADVAFMVDADWQGKGLGRLLHELLSDHAARQGVTAFSADVLVGNDSMLHILTAGGDARVRTAEGVHEVLIPTRRIDEDAPSRG